MKFVPCRLVPLFVLLAAAASPPALAADLTVTVDFTARTGRVAGPRHYGLNLFRVYDPAVSQQNATYKANLAAMHPGYVRVHSWEMLNDSSKPNGWTTGGNAWDGDKIRRALGGALPWKPTIMINVPWGPSGVTPDAVLTSAQEDAFAVFCASLVKIVNVDGKLGVTHFELPNERDGLYKGRGADLARVFVKAAKAMKQIDPTIKVGGAAFTQPWIDTVDPFLAGAIGDLDFVSYHTYSTGDGGSDLQKLFDGAAGLGGIATMFKDKLAKLTTRSIELYHDEYNISWAPPDARMTDARGAVFDALALIGFAQSDVTGAAAWNEADGWYGKLDSAFAMRPGAHVFALWNAHLVGPVVASTSSDPKLVVAFAVASAAGPAVALVNRSTSAQTVKLSAVGLDDAHVAQVTDGGRTDRAIGAAELSAWSLPPLSISVVTGAVTAPGRDAGAPMTAVDGGVAGASGGAAGRAGAGGSEAGAGAGRSGAAGTIGQGGAAGARVAGASGRGGAGGGSADEEPPRQERASGGCSTGGEGGAGLATLLLVAAASLARRGRRRSTR